ncbi:hypothetical protein SUGI_0241970 [Cryptomeria japonica]|uniref:disease resistance RPP13-like protein 4 n=1 Tax=Cryptomeria japonica TaxID=3369 RepID=UPI002408BBCF|nr:disease resistance RPP13-like protein 4 [Cryptomeria japonica]GLJ14871.1 hypothetical protein SUGI_0241970 [Cryptomeria japonica]
MASVAVELVVEKLCGMAAQKLGEAAKLVVNFREDLIWLNQQLKHVRAFLQDANQQSRHKHDVKLWLPSTSDIAMRAEDVFEECAVESMYVNDAQSCGFSCSQKTFRYRKGRQIKKIKHRMQYIIGKANQLGLVHQVSSVDEALPTTSERVTVNRRRSSLLPSVSDPMGIQFKVDEMLSLLDNSASPVIAVVGMGGIGKTYLLQHVYKEAKERYEKSIWLSVSQSCSISMLQKDLVFQFYKDEDPSKQIENSGISEQKLDQLINNKLQGTRCLVVLDDVWRVSSEEDLFTKLGLPTGNNSQCKIVVTTRSKDVCAHLNAHVYEMQRMPDKESWRLFCVYAFGEFEENIESQQELKEVGRKIVKKCGNLPLAVKTIAASLANTTILDKWELKLHRLEQVDFSNSDNEQSILDILKLSYDSLPAHLKACFTHLSSFPGDKEIYFEHLINLWIGEGFIPAGEEQWDVACDFLHQLVNLCLLELSERMVNGWLAQYCKIHDLLHDLAINISRENNCAFSLEEVSTHPSVGTGWCRISLANKDVDDNAISKTHPVCLRTLLVSHNRRITSIPENLFTAMRRLRVLDLSFTDISALPASVGKLKLLKMLNLRGTRIEEVPECVRHLKSLLYFAIDCKGLPVWIGELKRLQHLGCWLIDRMPKGITELASLRTLRSSWLNLSIEKGEFMMLEDLAKMTQLQEVRLIVRHEMELKRIDEGILGQLVKMRRLILANLSETHLPHIPERMTAMNISRVFISGILKCQTGYVVWQI